MDQFMGDMSSMGGPGVLPGLEHDNGEIEAQKLVALEPGLVSWISNIDQS